MKKVTVIDRFNGIASACLNAIRDNNTLATPACRFSIKIIWLCSVLLIVTVLPGCTSISKGAVLALLEKSESPDTRRCEGWGKPFSGIEPMLDKPAGKAKILMVHGVSDHIPGYSTQFQAKLAKELGLNIRSGSPKNIELETPLFPGRGLGNLRVARLVNAENGKEVIFYELTWSKITRSDKERLLAFDTSGDYDYRRAAVNAMVKKFSNGAIADPLMYGGSYRDAIQTAFGQSFCWMVKSGWEELPASGRHFCHESDGNVVARNIAFDDYIFISHSLGSRVVLDGLQRIAGTLPRQEEYIREQRLDERMRVAPQAIEAMRLKRIPIFMLSNQLPMLQLGREDPEIAGQEADYCRPEGRYYAQRTVSKTLIVALSDPNDLLSYGIPPGFREEYIDSRLCAEITNISINVAPIIDAFGVRAAGPGTAHTGYDKDDRIVALISKGIGTPGTSPLIKERCEYTPTIE